MFLRLCFALSLLLWSLLLTDLLAMILLTCLCCMLLLLQGAQATLLIRSFRLLLWLFVPITLFQGLFTPGMYVQYPIALPLTFEGLQRALWLCSHLLLMFIAALTCFRLLQSDEWRFLLLRVPWLGQRSVAYMLLLPELRAVARQTLQEQRVAWLEQPEVWYIKWQCFPRLLVESLHKMFKASKDEAFALWSNWSMRVKTLHTSVTWFDGLRLDFFYAALCGLGWWVYV
ncbi:MAG: hypothetical protein Q9M19_03545 [Mariprofundaceae bacterium]|nr:hypothetical protein [Mariprofundaceae bacterium]